MPLITACIICKNEEAYIESCVLAIRRFGFPVVVTDTGSTDRTVPIIKSLLTPQDKLCYFAWQNDFSAAKNYCAAQADSDWIWLIDADEILLECDVDAILSFISHSNNQNKIGVISRKDRFPIQGELTFATTRTSRIYHRNFYHYEGTIHEQLAGGSTMDDVDKPPSSTHSGYGITTAITSEHYADLPALFDHMGYATPEILKQKCRRNIALLENEYRKMKDPYLAYQLGSAYATLEAHETAVSYFEEGLSFDLDPALQYVQAMVTAYGYSLLELKRYTQALSLQGIYDTFAVTADFVFLMGLIYMNNALFEQAIAEFDIATTFQCCSVNGVNSFRALYNKGVILECTGRTNEAISAYQKCGDFEPALCRIRELSSAPRKQL